MNPDGLSLASGEDGNETYTIADNDAQPIINVTNVKDLLMVRI